MIRFAIPLALAVITAAAPIASAQTQIPDTDDNRYQFNRVEDGYLRLDLKTGQVSVCSRRATGWACVTVPDDRAAFDGEIARLQAENAALKKAMLDRGLPLPSGVTSDAPAARDAPVARDAPAARDGDKTQRRPSNADIDRMVTAVEKVWRRLVDMLLTLRKDMREKT